jgi:hypothetical protein
MSDHLQTPCPDCDGDGWRDLEVAGPTVWGPSSASIYRREDCETCAGVGEVDVWCDSCSEPVSVADGPMVDGVCRPCHVYLTTGKEI